MRFGDFFKDLTIERRPDAPERPTVTVILPTYARGHGPLQRAIDSVLSQSYDDFELILVDDGSRDGTADVLSDYLRADPRVVIHRYRHNSGLPALRVNQAALAARGRCIAYQFDDDVWTRDSLGMRVAELQRHDGPAVVYGNTELEIALQDGSVRRSQLGGPFSYAKLMNGNFLANNAVVHSAELFNLAGMYDPHILMRRYSDYDLWLRFGTVADFFWVDATVSKVHANQKDSLGRSVPPDFAVYRRYLRLDRRAALRPSCIKDYDVAGLDHLQQAFTDADIDRIRRRDIVPFLTTRSDYCHEDEFLAATASRRRRRTLLVTKPDFSTSVDVTVHNFTSIPAIACRSYFVAERDLPAADWNNPDTVVMYRTVAASTTAILKARKHAKTFIYLMDDNMLRFDEVGPEHAFLAPGTPARDNIEMQIREAHACIGYSEQIVEDMRQFNRHTMRLDTNIPLRFLDARPYERGAKLRIAILTGSVRRDILRRLWPAFRAFAKEAPDAVEFHVWGLDPAEFGSLPCTVHWRPFTHSYDLYRGMLMETSFDVALVPLDASTRAAQSKSPVKLLEATCCGAIGIFTDAPPYAALPGEICLKVENTSDGWIAALRHARDLGLDGRGEMLERARRFVRERYATERQINDFLSAFDAADLHAHLGDRRVAYLFHEILMGGATLHLLKHAELATSLGFDVVGVVRESEDRPAAFLDRWRGATGGAPLVRASWRSGYSNNASIWTQRPAASVDEHDGEALAGKLAPYDVGLVHAATWNPAASFAGRHLGCPVVFSLHQFYPTPRGVLRGLADAVHCSSLTFAREWEKAFAAPTRRIVAPVEDAFFSAYPQNLERLRTGRPLRRILVSGTIQPRKNQLEAIRALSILLSRGHDLSLDVIGYADLLPDYVAKCRTEVERLGLGRRVTIHGFVDRPEAFLDGSADMLVVASIDESMPQTVLQAMAAGLIVITADVGGVTELVRHRYTGIVAESPDAAGLAQAIDEALRLAPEERVEIAERAYRAISLLGRVSFVRAELVDLYNEAFEAHARRANSEVSEAPRKMQKSRALLDEDLPEHNGHLTDLAVAQGELALLQAQIDSIESSTSWRITAPLRALGTKFPPLSRLGKRLLR
ncbi:MAG: glycosyltransferase [Pseudomonadota bacterium]